MVKYSFEDVAPGLNAEVEVHSHSETGLTEKIDIHIHNTSIDVIHSFFLLEKNSIVHLLDETENILCELKNTSIQGPLHSIIDFIQLIIITCISTMNSSFIKAKQEFIAKPCIILHNNSNTNTDTNSNTNEIHPLRFTGFTPQQIRKAYNVTTSTNSSNSSNVVITIVIAYTYPKLQKDFDTFCKQYGLPRKTLKIATLGRKQDLGWAQEECLDTQWAYAMNTNATIQVVEAKSNSFDDMFSAVQYATSPPLGAPVKKPNIISMSWGAGEGPGQRNYEKYFSDKKICYLAASGDANFPNFPATSQNVLACGGTSLFLDNKNNRMNETTWSSAGCGISSIVSKPTYQNNIVKLNKYSNRAIPDIAGVANPNTGVLFVYDGVTSIVGGTSVSCPVFAGLLSNGISQRNNQGKQPLTTVLTSTSTNNIQSILYALTRDPSSYSTNFYDITVGNDGSFNASINYDVATGIGALNCQTITNTLANFTILKK